MKKIEELRKIDFEVLEDIWGDYITTFKEETVNLKKAVIYQVKSFEGHPEKKNRKVMKVSYLTVDGFKEGVRKISIDMKTYESLKKIGCFYDIDGKRYMPVGDVKCRCMRDYFGVKVDMNVTCFSDMQTVKDLAQRFRSVGKIRFVSMFVSGSKDFSREYRELVGIKSTSSTHISFMDVAKNMSGFDIYSGYMNAARPSLGFGVVFGNGSKTKDGSPLYAQVVDDVSGRASFKISVIAEVEGRPFVLRSKELNHRKAPSGETVASDLKKMISECEKLILHKDVSKETVKKYCLQYLPKKAEKTFCDYLEKAGSPIAAAYDVMETDIFNSLQKVHKTHGYDGGKSKYRDSLGNIFFA